jgi:hypothetical protein
VLFSRDLGTIESDEDLGEAGLSQKQCWAFVLDV